MHFFELDEFESTVRRVAVKKRAPVAKRRASTLTQKEPKNMSTVLLVLFLLLF